MQFYMSKRCQYAFSVRRGPNWFQFLNNDFVSVRIRTIVTGELCAMWQGLY